MKKTLLSVAVVALAFSYTSCQRCSTCTQTVTTSDNFTGNPPAVVQTTFEACGQDLKDAENLNSSTTQNVGGNVIVTTTTVYCD